MATTKRNRTEKLIVMDVTTKKRDLIPSNEQPRKCVVYKLTDPMLGSDKNFTGFAKKFLFTVEESLKSHIPAVIETVSGVGVYRVNTLDEKGKIERVEIVKLISDKEPEDLPVSVYKVRGVA